MKFSFQNAHLFHDNLSISEFKRYRPCFGIFSFNETKEKLKYYNSEEDSFKPSRYNDIRLE